MRWPAAAWLLLLTAATLWTPGAAAAEDNFAHRYVVYGRVVDNASQPVRDLLVDIGLDAALGAPEDCPIFANARLEALGTARTQRRTSERGDFLFCFHLHELPSGVGPAAVRIEAANFTTEFALDPVARVSFLNLQLDAELPEARTSALETNHTVIARLWYPVEEGTTLEGVPVLALPFADAPVTITADFGQGQVVRGTTRTNAYGDLAVDLPLPSRPGAGAIALDAAGKRMTLPLEATTGMTPFRFEVPAPDPGLSPATTIAIAGAAVAAVLAVAWYVARRASKR